MREHDDDQEHIPFGDQWTTEERARFAMLAQMCPMCDYKYRYAQVNQHLSIMHDMEQSGIQDDDPRMIAMANTVAGLSKDVMELGLMIASEQCATNAMTVRALIN
jgi:hypothetical protein